MADTILRVLASEPPGVLSLITIRLVPEACASFNSRSRKRSVTESMARSISMRRTVAMPTAWACVASGALKNVPTGFANSIAIPMAINTADTPRRGPLRVRTAARAKLPLNEIFISVPAGTRCGKRVRASRCRHSLPDAPTVPAHAPTAIIPPSTFR